MPTMTQFSMDPDDMRAIMTLLKSVGSDLSSHAKSVQAKPDAGASSNEVADALGTLAGAVAALSKSSSELADTVQAALTAATTTDDAVGQTGDAQKRSVEGVQYP